MAKVRIVHYINHFFAGMGGEERADQPLEVREGALGPARALAGILKDKGEVVATVVCGDNYFASHAEEARERVTAECTRRDADLLLAGPAFNAGRYGFACSETCQAVASSLGIPCVTAMYAENPGVEVYQQFHNPNVVCVPATDSAIGMNDALSKMVSIGLRMAAGQALGPAAVEGYIPRGVRKNIQTEKPGWQRAMEMLAARLYDKPFTTEIPYTTYDRVEPASPLTNLKNATLAVISTCGVTLPGNPDRFRLQGNVHWRKYSLKEQSTMNPENWTVVHGGYATHFMQQNPNLGVPLDTLREMERSGVFKDLHPYFYSVPGTGTSVSVAKRMGQEMAADLKQQGGIDGVLLVSA